MRASMSGRAPGPATAKQSWTSTLPVPNRAARVERSAPKALSLWHAPGHGRKPKMDAFDLTVEAAVEAGQVDTVLDLLRSAGDLDRRLGDVRFGRLAACSGA